MNIKEISNIVNFGLVVLTWMVQLIVYPGFLYYSTEDLAKWHQAYTPAISIIVIPLMFSQLFISGYLLLNKVSLLHIVIMALVIIVWVITFIWAVPAHNNIASGIEPQQQAAALVSIHWYRTVVWSAIFTLGIIAKYKPDGTIIE